jgi:small subunit ribosomal protein S1
VSNRPLRSNASIPQVDEAWWAALLAEEEKFCASRTAEGVHPEKTVVTHTQDKIDSIDWDYVQQLFEMDELIELSVASFNRGGLLVEGESLHGFVPISHLDGVPCDLAETEREKILSSYVGQSLSLKVIECDDSRGRVVFSERAAKARAGSRNQILDELKAGTCTFGVVTNITDFGVFVDLGGVEGLVHVSEISWGRVNHPSDAVKVGQKVQVYVLQVDKDRTRIALSLKRLCPNPWKTVEEYYSPGQQVDAVITSVVPFGAFARIEEGLDGLIHLTEMGLTGERMQPNHFLKEGQSVRVCILHIDAARQRLGLGLVLDQV